MLRAIPGPAGIAQLILQLLTPNVDDPFAPSEQAIIDVISQIQSGGGGGGGGGGVAGAAITVANEAALTAFNSAALIEGTWAYVQSHRSYWVVRTQAQALVAHEIIASSQGTRQWVRAVSIPHWSWTQQTVWFIDPAGGNDENSGATNITGLQTWAEFRRRTLYVTQAITCTILNSLQGTDQIEWEPVLLQASVGAPPALTINTLPTLGGNQVVVGANTLAQAGNQAALIDAGFAFAVGTIVQVTSGALVGATAVVLALVAGTQFRTTKWRNAAGAVVGTVPANADTVAAMTLPVASRLCLSHPKCTFQVTNLSITAVDKANTVAAVTFNVCQYNGFVQTDGNMTSNGCSIQGTVFSVNGNRARHFFNGSGFVGSFNTIASANFAFVTMFDCVIQQTNAAASAIECFSGGSLIFGTSMGIFSTGTGALLDVHNSGFCDVFAGTLYGTSATAAFGTRVRDCSRMGVVTASTPTLTTTAGGGIELDFEADNGVSVANAIPPLVAGAAVPAVSALVTWANWAAGPFNRRVFGYGNTAAAGTTRGNGSVIYTHV